MKDINMRERRFETLPDDAAVMSLDDVAAALQLSRTRVKQLQDRALKKMRAAFEQRGYGTGEAHD